MRLLSETLNELIGLAQETITRPARTRDFATDEKLAKLAAEVRDADARPAEGKRTTDAAMVMVIVLNAFFASDREPTSHLLGNAGVTLTWLRGEAWVALNNEKEARAS